MENVREANENVHVEIPQDVLLYIEGGRNPDVYTRQFSELLQKDNQFVNGKLQAMTVSWERYS